jgi:DNA-directed RNA polymerase
MQLSDQLAWEAECIERGSARYYANQDRMRNQGQVENTDVVSYLLRDRLEDIAQTLETNVNVARPGLSGKYLKLIRNSAPDGDYLWIAYIAVQCAFQLIAMKDKATITKLCTTIAGRLEADLKCQIFEAKHPGYYSKVVRSFDDQRVRDYQHKHKVMMLKFNQFGLDWTEWNSVERIHVGSKVLQAVMAHFGDVFFVKNHWQNGKTIAKLDTTDEFDKWTKEFEKERGFYFPMMLPLKIAPLPWDGTNDKHGGYYHTKLAHRIPLIKTRGKDHRAHVAKADPRQHRDALNKMQRTAWCINQRVLEVQSEIYNSGMGIGMPSNKQIKPQPFPEHLVIIDKVDLTHDHKEEIGAWKAMAKAAYGREQNRKGKIVAFMQSYKLAQELKNWVKFYFVYNCDFRGRTYCATSGLSPQGSDTARGILQFHKGVELGSKGAWWLAIQGANTYGYDKVSYDDRVDWIRSNHTLIQSIADNPIDNRALWGEADKPYQFLAFCLEWAACKHGTDKTFKSHIPVALDGSCNGLQHYSAMLRDEVGAKATNLTYTKTPSDLYADVAQVCTQKLWEISNSTDEDCMLAATWLKVGVDRKCTKRPVMTLPYGATQMSARMYVLEYVQDNWAKFNMDDENQWAMTKFLTPILWESIGMVVVKAREVMTWLRKNTGEDFCSWVTPIGFPVYQYYKDTVYKQVRTQLNGRLTLNIHDINSDVGPRSTLQKSGISPNFIHSIDATHMVMTVNSTDFPAYAMIHDDFGTHAGNTEVMYHKIREAMYKLYSENDVLRDWAEQAGVGTLAIPQDGTYNIKDILTAPYFFG